MKIKWLWRVLLVSVFAYVLLAGGDVLAQARKSGASAAAAGAATPVVGKEGITIKKFELNANIKAPDYSSNANEATLIPTPWARVLVKFDVNTEAEWLDQLEMKFYVLVKSQKTGVYTVLTGAFVYAEVPRGRNHQVAVYLRPRTVERFGVPEQAGVEINLRGETAAVGSAPGSSRWWQNPQVANLKSQEGYILDRSQSPFALIAPDNYEILRGK